MLSWTRELCVNGEIKLLVCFSFHSLSNIFFRSQLIAYSVSHFLIHHKQTHNNEQSPDSRGTFVMEPNEDDNIECDENGKHDELGKYMERNKVDNCKQKNISFLRSIVILFYTSKLSTCWWSSLSLWHNSPRSVPFFSVIFMIFNVFSHPYHFLFGVIAAHSSLTELSYQLWRSSFTKLTSERMRCWYPMPCFFYIFGENLRIFLCAISVDNRLSRR